METAWKEGIEQGRKEGIAQGIKEGIEQEIKKGIEQGRKKGIAIGKANANINIARKMKHLGISVEIIMQVTGLTQEEIARL